MATEGICKTLRTAAQRACAMSPSLRVMVNNSDDILCRYTPTAKKDICKTLISSSVKLWKEQTGRIEDNNTAYSIT